MDTLKEKLQITSLPLLNEDDLSEKLLELAKMLMNGYCIDNGHFQYQYRPIEIEFYIYDQINHPDRHVYPRNNKHAGDLFFHYSGMDICFESFEGCFGGILIRALERVEKDKDGNTLYFGGPLVCANEVLNTANGKCKVIPITQLDKEAVPFGRRVGIKAKNEEDRYFAKKYRFIREDINEKSIFTRTAYNFAKNIFEPKTSSYKIEEYIG
jgi:hypothetical protein